MTDHHDLIIRSQAGDRAAYAALVRARYAWAWRYAYSLLGDAQLAEDATQEAFLQSCQDLPTLREARSWPSWFRRLLHKHCDRIRRRRRPSVVPIESLHGAADGRPSSDELLIRDEVADAVQQALAALPDEQRAVATRYYFDEQRQADIATALGLTVHTVKHRLRAARRMLQGGMQDAADAARSLVPAYERQLLGVNLAPLRFTST